MRQVKINSNEPWRSFFEKMCVIGFSMNFAYAAVQASHDGHDGAAWFLGLGSLIMAAAIAWPRSVTTTVNIEGNCVNSVSDYD